MKRPLARPLSRHDWPAAAWLGLALCGLGLSACSTPARDNRPDAFVSPSSAPFNAAQTRERATRHLQLALAYYEQGQDAVALQEVDQTLRIDSSNASAYSLLGLIYQRQSAPRQAEASFLNAMQLTANAPGATAELGAQQHNYGWFLCQQYRTAEGQQQLQSALTQPGYAGLAKTWAALGECQWRAGQSQSAADSWQQALRHDPNHDWARARLAALNTVAEGASPLSAASSAPQSESR